MRVTSTLKTMMLKYDYTTICKNFKFITVPVEDNEFGQKVQRQIELVEPKDYTRQEIIDNFDLKTKVVKWIDMYTEDGKETMAVVLGGELK